MQVIRKGYQKTVLFIVNPFFLLLPFLFHDGNCKVRQIAALIFIIIAIDPFMQIQSVNADLKM